MRGSTELGIRGEDRGMGRITKGYARPGRPRDSAIDRRILNAAIELFLEGGAKHASMEGVAKRAGVGKVTVYRRWANRRELLVAAIRTQTEDMSVRGRDVRKNLEAILSQMAEGMLDGNAGVAFARVLSEKDSEPELLSIYRECGVWPRRKQIRDQLRKGRHEGLIRKDADLDVMVDMFFGVCIARLEAGVGYDGRFAAEAMDVFWRGAGR